MSGDQFAVVAVRVAHTDRSVWRPGNAHRQPATAQGLGDVKFACGHRRAAAAGVAARPRFVWVAAGRPAVGFVWSDGQGDVRGACGAAVAAALVSHTARFQLPGPGTVTFAGPAGGAAVGALHDPEPVVGQTW